MPVRFMALCFVNSTNNHGQRSMTSPTFSVLFHGACKARTKLIACLLVTASGYSSLAAADPLLDFRMFKAPEASQRMIRETKGNKVAAAKLLGLSRAKLYQRLPDGV